jgi:thiamine biosynthesis lipoprotein
MGTVASIDGPLEFMGEIRQHFAEVEARYSLHRTDSELSRVARAELRLADASDELLDTYARALEWRTSTDGAFSPHRPDGVIDLNGIVKADAIRNAGDILTAAACSAWTVNIGGDLLTNTAQRVGIADPHRAGALLCSLRIGDGIHAVATSGSAERGDHIWRGGNTEPSEFVQVTVVADDIVTADVLATAIISGGRAALDDAADRWPIDVLAVTGDGELVATPGIGRRLEGSLP